MRRTALVLLVSLLLGIWATAATAGDPPVPIEGKLLVEGAEDVLCDWFTGLFGYTMEGNSDNVIPVGIPLGGGGVDLSPLGDEATYSGTVSGVWPDCEIDIWRAQLDGSDSLNLTALAGLGGINCAPDWSPDGSMVAFQHCDPVPGVLPCDAGFHIWVVNSDGTGAHRVAPEEIGFTREMCWAPNGYRILCQRYPSPWQWITIDVDGTDIEIVPNIGHGADWSPDGAQIAYSRTVWDEGGLGWWLQLCVADADGGNPQALVEHFVNATDYQDHILAYGCPGHGWPGWLGPVYPEWSPRGDRIAFLAAGLGTSSPYFDPGGPFYKLQEEVWVYDLVADDLTKITDNVHHENWLSWNGDNTSPEDPEVTVDNATVTFSDVTDDGLTTILRDDDPPELPGGYEFCGEYYEVSTTATVAGPITICMTYEDEDVPGGNEEALCLLHYNEAIPGYEDITISRDPVNNVVCGEVDSLSVFGLAEIEMPVFGGFRPPINPDGSSVWKAGRTIPVKFALYDPLGNPICNATCHLAIWQVSSEILGSVPEAAEAVYADAGDTFRYCPEDQQYIYNLSTKGMATGTWMLRVTADGWPGFEATVLIGLR